MKTKEKQKNIPKGWKIKKIKDLLDYERPDNYIVKNTNYRDDKKIPVLTANKSFILGYTDEDFGIYENTPTIIFDDFTTDSKYVDFPFKVKSSAIKILKEKNNDIDLRFVYEKMKSIDFPRGNHKRYYISQYQEMNILTPPFKEQQKIAEILETVDKEIKKTNEIINKTEKLKRGIMQKLFIQKDRDKKFKNRKVNEIANVLTGKTPKRIKKEFYENGIFPWVKSTEVNFERIKDTSEKITKDAIRIENMKIVPKGAVLVAMYGQGVTRGKSAILDCEATTNQAIASIVPNSELTTDYLFYWLSFQYENLRNLGHGGNQKNLNLDIIKNIEIFLSDTNYQKKITKILSAVDEKISVNKKLKEKLTQLKKGLSQDLLSGEVRVLIT